MFIQTVSEAEAEGKVREVYDGDQETFGYVPNHAKVFSSASRCVEGVARPAREYSQEPLGAPLRTGHAGGCAGLEFPLLSARSRGGLDQERRQR